MRDAGKRITYHVIHRTGHCDLGDEMKLRFKESVVKELFEE
jgi:hypothetical protein